MDSQTLNSVQNCAYKYQLGFMRRLQAEEKAEALESGDLLHTIFKAFYTLRIKRPDLSYERTIELSIVIGNEHALTLNQSDESNDEVIFNCIEYFKFTKGEFWIPKHVEQPFAKVLYESEEEDLRIVYQGIVDLIVDAKEGECGVDHKSSRRNTNPYGLALSNQFQGYCWALGLDDFVVNKVGFQKTLAPKDRFTRHHIAYSKDMLDSWVKNTIFWGQQLAFYLENDTFPQNFTSCDKYSGCIFQNACMTDGYSREFVLQNDYKVGKEWNPQIRDVEFDARLERLVKEA